MLRQFIRTTINESAVSTDSVGRITKRAQAFKLELEQLLIQKCNTAENMHQRQYFQNSKFMRGEKGEEDEGYDNRMSALIRQVRDIVNALKELGYRNSQIIKIAPEVQRLTLSSVSKPIPGLTTPKQFKALMK